MKDYYQILGVNKDATTEEIKSQYRKLAAKYHPDVNSDSDATKKMASINEAYSILKDSEKRKNYDLYGMHDDVESDSSNNTYQYYNPNSSQYTYYNGYVYNRNSVNLSRTLFRMILFMIISFFIIRLIWSAFNRNDSSADPLSVFTYGYVNEDSVYVTGDGTNYLYNGPKEINIPKTYAYRNKTYDVKGINRYSFQNNRNLEKVFITNNIDYIGSYAFYGCSNLKSIYFYGTEEEFKNIKIEEGNSYFKNAEVVFLVPNID